MLVSHYWAEVIKAAPSMWQVVDFRDPAPMWVTALERSQSAPLVIRVHPTLKDMRKRGGGLDLFWKAVCPHSKRWQSVDVALEYSSGSFFGGEEAEDEDKAAYDRTLSTLEICDASSLEEVKLTLRGCERGGGKVVDLFRSWEPSSSLQTVWLEQVALRDWGSQHLSDLRSLTLRRCRPGPSADQLIGIVRGSSLLERIVLQGLRSDGPSIPDNIPAIQLPRLVELNTDSVYPVISHRLFNGISITAGNHFTFAGPSRTHKPARDLVESYFRSKLTSSKALKISVNAEDPRINLRVERVAWSPPLPRMYLEFAGSNMQITSVLDWVSQVLNDTELLPGFETTLSLLTEEDYPLEEIFDCLRNFAALNSLIINGLGDSFDEDGKGSGVWAPFVQHLALPIPGEEGQHQWRLPKLTHLSLLNCSYGDAKAILGMVENRIAAAEATEGGGEEGGSARLQALMIGARCEMDEETVRALRRAFGTGVVALRFGCKGFASEDDDAGYFVGRAASFAPMVKSQILLSVDVDSLTIVI